MPRKKTQRETDNNIWILNVSNKKSSARQSAHLCSIKRLSLYTSLYSSLRRESASHCEGRAGMAPFLVVVIAPQAFANLSTFLNLSSS